MTKEEYLKEYDAAAFSAFVAAKQFIISGDSSDGTNYVEIAANLARICLEMDKSNLFTPDEKFEFLSKISDQPNRPEKIVQQMAERMEFVLDSLDSLKACEE